MNKKQIMRLGLVILVVGLMTLGYGGICKKKSSHTSSGSSGTLPDQVTLFNPSDEATDIPITQDLTWSPPSGATSYDVYFGYDMPPITLTFQANTSGTSYDPGILNYNTTYYWRIDSKNSAGTTTGVLWSFTTQAPPPPAQVTSPNPSNGTANIPITTPLIWATASGATSYDVYFDDFSPPTTFRANVSVTSYNPSITYSETYYWQIDSKNTGGTTTGNIWNFQTEAEPIVPPDQVTSPDPTNGATDIPITQQLGWASAIGATSYDVYFDDFSPPTTFKANVSSTSYNPGSLDYSETYYWQIDSKNNDGTTTGNVWSFTTMPEPPETVSTPNQPTGTTSGTTGTSYEYSTGGASSNLGHTVEYQFDWKGDGTDLSTWSSATQLKTWIVASTYSVRARARCATHTSVVSSWSSRLSVSISLNPTLAGSYNTPDYAQGVYVSGSYAYVAGGASGLQIINISDPTNPILAGTYDTPGYALRVYVSGSYAYVADRESGLQIINISDPANPTLAGSYNTPDYAQGVYVSGSYAYVADYTTGLLIINISNPTNPTLAGSYDTPGCVLGVYVSGSYAYVADGLSGLQIINISNPANPTLSESYDTPGNAIGVYVSGSYAYVADSYSGLQIINISDPTNPTFAGSYDTPDWAWIVYVSGSYAYVADEDSGLQIINISDPTNPSLAGTYDTPDVALGVYVSGSYAYVADYTTGLLIIGGIE